MKNVALIANMTKPQACSVAQKICSWCRERGIGVYAQEELGCGDASIVLGEPLPQAVDLVMVLGGDGTFLSVARRYTGVEIPFLGVNLGRLGFLTEVEVTDLENSLEKLIRRQYAIEKRAMLSVQVVRQGAVVEDTFGLNEVTVAKGPLARIIQLDVAVDNVPIGSYHGDGLIISTPTGSTGYSLSAGGPIVAPDVDLSIITPICPHTLNARPIVVSRDAAIAVDVKSAQRDVVMTVDGQHSFDLKVDDRLEICKSQHHTALVRLDGMNFFDILRRKLMEQNR